MGDEKLHVIVARSTFPSQNARNASCSEHFWEFRCSKSACRCGAKHISTSKRISTSCSDHSWKLRCRNAKHISKSKVLKTDGLRPLLEVEMLKKCAKHMSSKCKNTTCCDRFWTFRCRFAWQVQGIHRAKRRGFVAFPKTMADIWRGSPNMHFAGRGSTRDISIRDVRRSGRRFPHRGCILERQIFRFATMILRDRCSTSYDLASLFRGRRSTLDRWNGKIAKRIGTRPSALHSTFRFWRKSRRIASFLMLSTSKIEEVLQNCFVFDVEIQKLRESRKTAAFLMLSSSKIEEVSQNSFVSKLADR